MKAGARTPRRKASTTAVTWEDDDRKVVATLGGTFVKDVRIGCQTCGSITGLGNKAAGAPLCSSNKSPTALPFFRG